MGIKKTQDYTLRPSYAMCYTTQEYVSIWRSVALIFMFCMLDSLYSWSQILETLPLPNIKWICPTAPTQPVAVFGGFPCTAWFDVGDISGDAPDNLEGLDASAAYAAQLLSTEPADSRFLSRSL
ncbi:lysophospholipase [Ranunculus cassubicifolius]